MVMHQRAVHRSARFSDSFEMKQYASERMWLNILSNVF